MYRKKLDRRLFSFIYIAELEFIVVAPKNTLVILKYEEKVTKLHFYITDIGDRCIIACSYALVELLVKCMAK